MKVFANLKSIFLRGGAIFVLLLALACEKDAVNDERASTSEEMVAFRSFEDLTPNDEASVNEVRTVLARTLAKALQNNQVRAYIHQKMSWAYASNYEMIYIAEKDSLVNGTARFADVLKAVANPQIINQYGQDFFDRITEISPLIAISIPDWDSFNGGNWDVSTIPNVTAVLESNEGYDLKMFDAAGNTVPIEYDIHEDGLTVPSLGVWDAEGYYLITANGTFLSGISIDEVFPQFLDECSELLEAAITALQNYYNTGLEFYLVSHENLLSIYNHCMGLDDDDGGGNGDPCEEDCERDCEDLDEHLVDFKINGWGVFKNIRNQPFENKYVFHGVWLAATRLDFGSSDLGPLQQRDLRYVSPVLKKGDILDCSSRPCQGKWIKSGLPFRLWTDWMREELGSPYVIDWSEVDNQRITIGGSIAIAPKFKLSEELEITTTYTFSFQWVGELTVLLGSQQVFYCDPILKPNNTGSVTFRCD